MAISISMTNDQARLVLDALIQIRTKRPRKALEKQERETVDALIGVERQIYEKFREQTKT